MISVITSSVKQAVRICFFCKSISREEREADYFLSCQYVFVYLGVYEKISIEYILFPF